MSDKVTAEQVAKAVGSAFGVVLVVFAAFISALFSLAKKTK